MAAEDKEISVLRGCQKMSLPICFLSSDTASANLIRPVNTSLIVIHEGSCSFAHTSSQRLISFPVTVIRCRIVARGPGGRGGGWRGGSKLSESVKNEMRRV